MPQGEVVADFSDYQAAVAFVENLIAHNFPAGSVAIVGSDLRTVERVRAKLSYAKVALGGATTGAWLGLIIGLIFGPGVAEPANADQLTSVESAFSAVLIGAGIGMLFNVIRFSLARNKRGFISASSVVASKYQVQVPGDLAEQAKGIPVHEH
jgi:hypothetical protein